MLDGKYDSLRQERADEIVYKRIRRSREAKGLKLKNATPVEVKKAEPIERGKIHFNETMNIVNSNRPPNTKEVTRALLSTHLTKMVRQRILHKKISEKGYEGFYTFTTAAKLLRKLGISEHIDSERDRYDYDETRDANKVLKKLLRKILYTRGVGITSVIRKKRAEPGDIFINNQTYEIHHDDSFSIKDIIENQLVNSTNITFSSNVKIKDEDVEPLMDFCKNQLRITDPAIFDDSHFNMTEFNRARKIIKNYFSICCEISAYIILRLQLTWTHIRKHRKQELAWYFETLGRDRLLYFLEYEMKRKKKYYDSLGNEIKREFKKEVRRRISVYDQLIIARQKELDGLLNNLDTKFYSICNLIKNLSYPQFMSHLLDPDGSV